MERKICYILQHTSNHPLVVCIPQSAAICVANGYFKGIVVNFGYESGWVSLVVNGCSSFDSEEIELNIQPRDLFSLIESIVERSQMTNVKLCLFFVGGNLKENLITQLKHCFYKCRHTMDYLSEISFNSQSNSTLFAGVEYVNSYEGMLYPRYFNWIDYSDKPEGLHIPILYMTSIFKET